MLTKNNDGFGCAGFKTRARKKRIVLSENLSPGEGLIPDMPAKCWVTTVDDEGACVLGCVGTGQAGVAQTQLAAYVAE